MELYCITCQQDMISVIEAAQHMMDYGCVVSSEPKAKVLA